MMRFSKKGGQMEARMKYEENIRPNFEYFIEKGNVVTQGDEVTPCVLCTNLSTQNGMHMTSPLTSIAPMKMLPTTSERYDGVQNMSNAYVAGDVVTTPSAFGEKDRERLLNAQIHMSLDYYRHTLRKEENKQKEALKGEREQSEFSRKRRKEFERTFVYEDGNGYLQVQSLLPEEKEGIKCHVLEKQYIKLYNLVSGEPICKIQMVTWDGLKASIILIGKDCSSRGLAKALAANGVSVDFRRDKRRLIENQIYAYLVDHAEERYVKRNFGWFKTDHGWEFATESELTIQDILDEYARKENK